MSKQIEDMVPAFWEMMEANQFVKSTNSITDKVEEYPLAIVDMDATVKINGEFDKYAIDKWLTTFETQIRESERERILGKECQSSTGTYYVSTKPLAVDYPQTH